MADRPVFGSQAYSCVSYRHTVRQPEIFAVYPAASAHFFMIQQFFQICSIQIREKDDKSAIRLKNAYSLIPLSWKTDRKSK